MRKIRNVIMGIFLLSLVNPVYASYVLPYPSFMPGNKLYKIVEIVDKLKGYWAIGNIAQVKYHLSLADKYLVEAKTLMEYKQYKLGVLALNRSVYESQETAKSFRKAKAQYGDMSSLGLTLSQASLVHQEVLKDLMNSVPKEVVWEDEHESPITLKLQETLEKAIDSVKQW